jgi:hypothetical protein
MFTIQYTGLTNEERNLIQAEMQNIKRLEDQEYREVPEFTSPIGGEVIPAHQEALPRAVRIQTTSVESTPDGNLKVTLQGEKADEEGALLEGRLASLNSKKV